MGGSGWKENKLLQVYKNKAMINNIYDVTVNQKLSLCLFYIFK